MWITHNQAWSIAQFDIYQAGSARAGYEKGHHLLLSHGRTYRLYEQKYRATQKGQVGIAYKHQVGEPMDASSLSDIEATERHNQFSLGWFAQPIFGNGDYPDVMKWQVGNKSLEQGRLFNTSTQSRLPGFTEDEKRMLKGSADFFGYNIYTGYKVRARVLPLTESMGYEGDKDSVLSQDPGWPGSGSPWLKITPWFMRTGLNWIRTHYNNPPIFITENGVSDNAGTVDDDFRSSYIRLHTNEMLKAILMDGCKVIGYTAWSFLDNFEWTQGFSERFGLHYVNFSDPNRPRTTKGSARAYTELIEANGFFKNNNNVKTSPAMTSHTAMASTKMPTRLMTSYQTTEQPQPTPTASTPSSTHTTLKTDPPQPEMTSPAKVTSPKAAVVTFNNHDAINAAVGNMDCWLPVMLPIVIIMCHILASAYYNMI